MLKQLKNCPVDLYIYSSYLSLLSFIPRSLPKVVYFFALQFKNLAEIWHRNRDDVTFGARTEGRLKSPSFKIIYILLKISGVMLGRKTYLDESALFLEKGTFY